MNKLQQKAFNKKIHHILACVGEKETDQVSWRVVGVSREDSNTYWQIETRIVNPDDDYDSGWQWTNVIGLGPRGRII